MTENILKEKMAAYFAAPEQHVCRRCRPVLPKETELSGGAALDLRSPLVPETALEELKCVLKAWDIPLKKEGYPLIFEEDPALEHEEFRLETTSAETRLSASDSEGFRRGLYFLAARLEHGSGPYLACESVSRKQKIKNRISRSFYGPTHRPPFNIDELMDDVDYYPEPYLNRLAREGINGLWLTVLFNEVTFSSIQAPDPFMEKRLAKLRSVVDKCKRYGIRIFAFCIEPQGFVGHSPLAEKYPVLAGITNWGFDMVGFCPSSETAQKHFYEQTRNLFSRVPGLGGLLNITSGEQLSSCFFNPIPGFSCPRCSKLPAPQILRNLLDPMVKGMKEAAPEAEMISWFYHSSPAKECAPWVCDSAAGVPEGVVNLYNFESGISVRQQGVALRGGDYWNSKKGPAPRFSKLAKHLEKRGVRCGAKLQISNGHELATVPVIPVPGLLYAKYKFLTEHQVDTVMYCWYFGSFPGVMNRAAALLGSWDFKRSEQEFLTALAEEEWGEDAPVAAEAWKYFSKGYYCYPLCTDIQYNGPFHHGITWPLYPEVRFGELYASWKPYPVSGDSIGRCLGTFTLEKMEKQAALMAKTYRKGLEHLLPLREKYAEIPSKLTEIDYAHAVGLLLESGWHIARFYLLRRKLYEGSSNVLKEMEKIIRQEIENSRTMMEICRREFLIGYHSESENMKFTPETLAERITLLEKTLAEELPDLRRRLAAGESPRFPEGSFALTCRPGELHDQKSFSWTMKSTGKYLHFTAECRPLENPSADRIYFIFCDELYSSMPQVAAFSSAGQMKINNRFLIPEKVKFQAFKDGSWRAGFSVLRSQLESKPTFNVFRQSQVNGKTVVDSWYPEPGLFGIGSSHEVMRSAAMGRLAAEKEKGKKS
ncbi:MAG: hypothetical protein IJV93_11710 [Lentisphaeria bacterium]|nr:hypothetical protein [Lentisphaeria bacterium]